MYSSTSYARKVLPVISFGMAGLLSVVACGSSHGPEATTSASPVAASSVSLTAEPQAETGCQLDSAAVAQELGHPNLVQDSARVCGGEWAYWPASGVVTGKNLLLHKAPSGKVMVIVYGGTSTEVCAGSYDLPPVPDSIRQAAGCR
ncbi:hypothetical protein ACFXHA_39140 [Nocardia sp. NPDC059240]|uniref:hypothetical protein n=1 Tax=Nocardia sp. NPDC059240 TaxID=3346786 RepID=UPI0036C7A62C